MEINKDSPTITQFPEINKNYSKKLILLILGLIILAAGIFLFILLKNNPNSKPAPHNKPSTTPNLDSSYKHWVNCDDVRDVIEEDDKIYAACLGGVIVVQKDSGKVIDQITRTDGLGSSTTTSLIKKDEKLFIGTQDGFTIFDLNSRKAKKISEPEGLINGSNIILELDGNSLWVGTFRGLSKYDIQSGQITNYTSDLADNSTSFSVNDILATPDYIYVIISANAMSQGSVSRFSKTTGKWERFGPEIFGKTGDFSRIDFNHITYTGNTIFISNFDSIWKSKESPDLNWEKVDLTTLSNPSQGMRVIKDKTPKLYFITDNDKVLYELDSITGLIKQVNIDQSILENHNWNNVIYNNKKIWIPKSGSEEWLTGIDPVKQNITKIALHDRPSIFLKIVGIIDGNPIVGADNGLWQYDLQKNKFSILSENFTSSVESPPESLVFYPIPDTKYIFLFSQLCGQGCSQPEISLLDYSGKNSEQIIIPDNIVEAISSIAFDKKSQIFNQLIFDSYDKTKQEFKFFTHYEKKQLASFNLKTKQWSLTDSSTTAHTDTNTIPITCNSYYDYSSTNAFSGSICNKNLETGQFNLSILQDDKNAYITQIDKKSGAEEKIMIKGALPEYSPFEGFDNTVVFTARVINNLVWIATNRGLIKYDPRLKSMETFDTEDGLISNEVTTFLVDDNFIWTVTNWGGLSRIPH